LRRFSSASMRQIYLTSSLPVKRDAAAPARRAWPLDTAEGEREGEGRALPLSLPRGWGEREADAPRRSDGRCRLAGHGGRLVSGGLVTASQWQHVPWSLATFRVRFRRCRCWHSFDSGACAAR
jgi:hypothetical protein